MKVTRKVKTTERVLVSMSRAEAAELYALATGVAKSQMAYDLCGQIGDALRLCLALEEEVALFSAFFEIEEQDGDYVIVRKTD